MLDCTVRVQIRHRPGMLAQVAGAIATSGGLIGDIVTVAIGRDTTIRDLTVEVRDLEHADQMAADLGALDGIQVLWYRDRALLRHEGGKLQIGPLHPVESIQEMRDVYTPGVARVCRAIAHEPGLAGRYTMIGRSVASAPTARACWGSATSVRWRRCP